MTRVGVELRLRPCAPLDEGGEGDARLVFAWRNDPETRAASFHQEPKAWDDFRAKHERMIEIDPAPPVLALRDGKAVGFLRFEAAVLDGFEAPTAAISINVAPEARGQGAGAAMLRLADRYAAAHGVSTLYAEARLENDRSARAFLSAGYRDLGTAEKLVEDTGERVAIRCFARALDICAAASSGPSA